MISCVHVFAVVAALALSLSHVLATDYVVGSGTCLPGLPQWHYGCDYQSWATQHELAAGDYLVFEFVEGQSTVASVSNLDYDRCIPGSTTATNDTRFHVISPTTFPLPTAGTYHFVSSVNGICGQKLAVTVITAKDTEGVFGGQRLRVTARYNYGDAYCPDYACDTNTQAQPQSSGGVTVGGLVASYAFLLGLVSLVVYCVLQRRKQQQMLQQMLAAPRQTETSPVLYHDGQNQQVEVNAQGGYVPYGGVHPDSNTKGAPIYPA